MILSCPNNRRTQLLFTTGIERGIHDRQVLKYQPLVTSRLMFQYSMIIDRIRWWNITLDATNGWHFRTWRSWMPRSMPVAKSNWVRLLNFCIGAHGCAGALGISFPKSIWLLALCSHSRPKHLYLVMKTSYIPVYLVPTCLFSTIE